MDEFVINDVTLREMGWPHIQAALGARAATANGQELARGLAFLPDREAVRTALARVEEARELGRRELVIPVAGAEDVRPALERVAKGGVLAPAELLACARTVSAASRVRSFLEARKLEAPLLGRMGESLPALGPLASRIEDTLEPSGAVRDGASEALAMHRQRARALHQQIQGRIDGMLHDPAFSSQLRESYYSTRNDRYVLPVVASFRAKVPGIVHNASQSGQTLFIEPEEIIGLGNELSIAESLAAEEERRVLAELSEDVGGHVDELRHSLALLAQIDLVQASARLAVDLDASSPNIAEPHEALELYGLRHAVLLLQGKKVIANDVRLDPEQRALVVSGPNAGGKTVTITAIGLCGLMLRAGLPVPADSRSVLPICRGVVSAIGDAQDLARDLSTFSAHLTRLRDILVAARGGWWVLVDEIAADTDPREGAAIAAAVLGRLVQRQARVFVTTHLEEVKALGVTDPRFVNARVGLDAQTMRPTYRLELGAAGMSNALEIAAQVGLPADVLAEARERVRSGSQLTLALARVEEMEREIERRRRDAEAEREAAVSARQAALAERAEAERLRGEAEQRARAELAGELEEARQRVGHMIAELQAAPSMRLAQKAQQALEEQAAELAVKQQRHEARRAVRARQPVTSGAGEAIKPGARVRVVSLAKDGEVLSVVDGEATVAVGPLRMRAKLDDLVVVGGQAPKARSFSPGDEARERRVRVERGGDDVPSNRLDLRGQRADEALRALESFLDVMFLKGPSYAIVVHGHGTGALKEALRDMLRSSPYVATFRPGDRHEGGDAVTVIELREQ